jgi:hypothetical protein
MKRHWFKIPSGPDYEAQRPLLAALEKLKFSIGADHQIGSLREFDGRREVEIIFKTRVPDKDHVQAVRYMLCSS